MVRSSQTFKINSMGKKIVQKNMLGHLTSESETKADPLGDHRARLVRGNLFAHWNEGGQRFFSVTKDISTLKWKKEGSKSSKDIKSILLNTITSVTEGCRPSGHRRGTKAANNNRAFSISTKDGNKTTYIDLEASTKVERDRWVKSLQTAVDLVKNGTL